MATTTASTTTANTKFSDLFQARRNLTKGQFGSSFIVTEQPNGYNEFVAKRLDIEYGQLNEPEAFKAILDEAILMTTFKHPNVAVARRFLQEDTAFYIVVDSAPSLASLSNPGVALDAKLRLAMKRNAKFKEEAVFNWFAQLAIGLHYLHVTFDESKPFLHRQIRPSNIWLCGKDRVAKWTGFGLIESAIDIMRQDDPIAIQYQSPEICDGQNYSTECDIWSFGVVLYQMLTLKLPFFDELYDETDAPEVRHKRLVRSIKKAQYVKIHLPPKLPTDPVDYLHFLSASIEVMLVVEPDKRPNASQIVEAVGRIYREINEENVPAAYAMREDMTSSVDVESIWKQIRPKLLKASRDCDSELLKKAIEMAVKEGVTKTRMANLLERPLIIDAIDANEDGYAPMHWAAMSGNIIFAMTLYECSGQSKSIFNTFDRRGMAPIHICTLNENVDMLRWMLISMPVKFDARESRYNRTALHIACEKGSIPIVDLLLSTDATAVNSVDASGNTPLHIAAAFGQLEIAQMLLENKRGGISLLAARDKDGDLPLHRAAVGEDELAGMAVADYLLKYPLIAKKPPGYERDYVIAKRQISEINTSGHRTAMFAAARHGNAKMVEFLLIHGADVEVLDEHRNTALHAAIVGNHLAVVKILLMRAGTELIKTKNLSGNTPLHCAAISGADVDILQALLLQWRSLTESTSETGAFTREQLDGMFVETRNVAGRTPFLSAAANGHAATIEFLAEHGANLEATVNSYGAIHLAAYYGHVKTIEVLLHIQAGMLFAKTTDRYGSMPIQIAILGGQVEALKYLRKHGAKIEVEDDIGRPIMAYVTACKDFEKRRAIEEVLAQCKTVVSLGRTTQSIKQWNKF